VNGVVMLRDSEIDPFVFKTIAAIWPGSHLERWRSGEPVRYVPLPRHERVTALIPPSPSPVAAAALRHHRAYTSRRERRLAQLRSVAARAGGLRLTRSSLAVVAPEDQESLIGKISGDLGVEVWAAIHLGPPRANRKPILHLIARTGESIAFVKVGFNQLTQRLVRAEAVALETLAQIELRELTVPKVLGAGRWRQCEYLVLSPVSTESQRGIDADRRHRAMHELVSALPTTREVLLTSKWWRHLQAALRDRDHSEARELLDLSDRLGAVCGSSRVLMGAAHGDWAPWNMATTRQATVVWDWERFAHSVPVGLDSLHYAVEDAVRSHGLSPRRAVHKIAGQAGQVVVGNGAPSELGVELMALYLLAIGERYVTDRQDLAGASRGDLRTWLLPELTLLVEAVEGSHV
jgi:hypothetical protein